MLRDDLEIFIITYNRKKYLAEVLDRLLAENSPIRACKITCLDNNSDDGTDEVVRQKQEVIYIKNRRNVGLMGNFAKCVELCSKKYLWVLCDNDEIDFSAFADVEQAIAQDAALINVSCVIPRDPQKIETVLAQSIFLPAMIFNTRYINDCVMSHVMCNIHTVFAQCTLTALIYNQAQKDHRMIACTSQNIINYGKNIKIRDIDTYNVDRVTGNSIAVPERFRSNNQHVSVIYAFSVLDDKKLYNRLTDFLATQYLSFKYIADKLLLSENGSDFRLFVFFFMTLNGKQRLRMLYFLIRRFLRKVRKSIKKHLGFETQKGNK